MKYIFWGIVIYFFVRFVFNFLIPLFRATRQMRDQVKDFQSRMEEQQNFQRTAAQQQQQAKPKVSKEDYIDFEEIK
ncbi:MAG: hypothetical protein JNK79_02755 [Chitinophagaceae bacterium]|nr:hypothetical protein [Chitinophagaceae bacterium]